MDVVRSNAQVPKPATAGTRGCRLVYAPAPTDLSHGQSSLKGDSTGFVEGPPQRATRLSATSFDHGPSNQDHKPATGPRSSL